jgi:predicted NAD-dependent protein-ADP-ribosyltransferase YbiA (DUF1768 family)
LSARRCSSRSSEIRFYRASEKPYEPFSSLYRRSVVFEGEEFATSEHAYQAGKARKPAVRRWLLDAPSPALLAMAAHGLYYWEVAPGWSTTKFDRMRAVLSTNEASRPVASELIRLKVLGMCSSDLTSERIRRQPRNELR